MFNRSARVLAWLLGLVMLLALLPGAAFAEEKTTALEVTAGYVSVGQRMSLTATLYRVRSNEKNRYLPDQTITFLVDDVVVGTAVTNATADENHNKEAESGYAVLPYVVAVEPGVHTVTAVFAGDNQYDPATATATLRVKLPNQSFTRLGVSVKQILYPIGSAVPITVRIYPIYGSKWVMPADRTVTVVVDGSEVFEGVTNEGGVAEVYVPALPPAGRHYIEVTFAGDDEFVGSSARSFFMTK